MRTSHEEVRKLDRKKIKSSLRLHTALIAERDAYMAQSLLGASGRRIVAVVGLAHCDGIEAAILGEAGASIRPKPRACAA